MTSANEAENPPPHAAEPAQPAQLGFWAHIFQLHVSPAQWVASATMPWRRTLGPIVLLVLFCQLLHGIESYRGISTKLHEIAAQWGEQQGQLRLDEEGFHLAAGEPFVYDDGRVAVVLDPEGQIPLKSIQAQTFFALRNNQLEIRNAGQRVPAIEGEQLRGFFEVEPNSLPLTIDSRVLVDRFELVGPAIVVGLTLLRDGVGDIVGWLLCGLLAASFWGPGRGRLLGLETAESIKISLAICVPMVIPYTVVSIAARDLGMTGLLIRVAIITGLAMYTLPRPRMDDD